MYKGNKARLGQHPELASALAATHGPVVFDQSSSFWSNFLSLLVLIDRNYWNGRIMERIRAELQGDAAVEAAIREEMDKFEKSGS